MKNTQQKIKKLNKLEIIELFKILQNDNPEPKGELMWTNPYTLLVAVALSAQATDIGVNKATKELFNIVETPQDMLDLGLDNLILKIKSIGLYNSKAKNIIAAAKMLTDDYNGIVPNSQAELEKLPGVGRKTANVVRSIAFKEPTIAVDTHVFRVSRRTGLSTFNTVNKVEDNLLKVIPKEFLYHAHHWLILHGRYTCKARTPLCVSCKIEHICKKNLL